MLTSPALPNTPDWKISPPPKREQLLEDAIQMYIQIGELYRKMGRILGPEIDRRNEQYIKQHARTRKSNTKK